MNQTLLFLKNLWRKRLFWVIVIIALLIGAAWLGGRLSLNHNLVKKVENFFANGQGIAFPLIFYSLAIILVNILTKISALIIKPPMTIFASTLIFFLIYDWPHLFSASLLKTIAHYLILYASTAAIYIIYIHKRKE
ncbi:MAG TPA: hypothetical protein VMD74_02110 [Candidatus Methylomirabilis sp.]|nr:hypothetical protein [Candidatus Methylomirabilis sp.]